MGEGYKIRCLSEGAGIDEIIENYLAFGKAISDGFVSQCDLTFFDMLRGKTLEYGDADQYQLTLKDKSKFPYLRKWWVGLNPSSCAEIRKLSFEDLGFLIRGKVLAEKLFGSSGGSVGEVIWLFRDLVNRRPDREWLDELTEWIIDNTNNHDYYPFGQIRTHGARNYSEFIARETMHKENSAKIQEKEREQFRVSRLHKEAYAEFKSNSISFRNSGKREQYLEWFNALTLVEQLKVIAESKYTANFFPNSTARRSNDSVLDKLSYGHKKAIALRMIGRQKGPWGQFKKRLYKDLGEEWNRLDCD